MEPAIDVLAPTGPVRAVVLVLHGGSADGYRPVHRFRLPYLRMVPFARAVRRRGDGVAVWLLRHRYGGWNAPHLHPVEDARWALDRIRRTHPDVPVVLVGHSMGGRTALRVADDPQVVAVCALAPWIEDGEPYEQLAGRAVLIAHGDRERTTDPAQSYRYAEQAKRVTDRVARFSVHGDGHAMLLRARDWTRLVADFVLGELEVEPLAPYLANAMREPSPRGLDVPLRGTRGGKR
ncbi:pimeloyl-ACP methyl ester carboxylesterase [Saccharothrix tamanrassetensis]|uniref:Pimeloyl-ACP methyl ester carboxylesterase n=1 Tax=Saccharothrix tamanrassetensis TaxID=1051531 RepID=A0A841CMI1_9PSEU|nr:alpha/beta fold hydrolase [Saccharothrix tamanrassetensis]MBB5956766.1 pimeloyl-ACP methyl ester carboxylesterase [Saccharothrix tamanrassetensis]